MDIMGNVLENLAGHISTKHPAEIAFYMFVGIFH